MKKLVSYFFVGLCIMIIVPILCTRKANGQNKVEKEISKNEVEVNNKRKEIIKAFSFFDKDKNGLINAAEFRKILTDMCDINPDELDELIDRSDIDGDGFINYVELAYLLIK